MNLSHIATGDLLAEISRRNWGHRDLSASRNEEARQIIMSTCNRHSIPLEDLFQPRGPVYVCACRDEICSRLSDAGFSHTMIAALLRRTAPSTVFKAVKRFKERMA